MGFVNYVYPSAIHTRFEHSLGTATIADKLYGYVKKKKQSKDKLEKNDLMHLRLAAILHDIGHCMFSHTSEVLYEHMLIEAMDEEFGDSNVDPSAHEFLAYLLIKKTKAFDVFFGWLSDKYKKTINKDTIANYIVGKVNNEAERFKASFINGPFDADKLDYLYRDSIFSGIPVQLDLDRLYYEIAISKLPDESGLEIYDLTIGMGGVSSLEQILFNKMMLTSAIYHHQKVKTFDCMYKGVIEYLVENNIHLQFRGRTINFKSPLDFLLLTDIDLLSYGLIVKDKFAHDLIHNILYRRPLKRALIISSDTIEGDTIELLSTKFNLAKKEGKFRILSEQICKQAGNPCSKHEVWIDMPSPPDFQAVSPAFVRTNKMEYDKELKML